MTRPLTWHVQWAPGFPTLAVEDPKVSSFDGVFSSLWESTTYANAPLRSSLFDTAALTHHDSEHPKLFVIQLLIRS